MSIEFAANLSSLRREKNITQKDAAEALGVSQALLSHYEKGIRECNLDFVKRAADYYGVSSDYLLGVSEARQALNEIAERGELASDSKSNAKTVLRSLLYLAEQTEYGDEASEIFFTDYFTLCIRKYLALLSNTSDLSALCDLGIAALSAPASETAAGENVPLSCRTIGTHSDLLLKKVLENSVSLIEKNKNG